MNVHVHKNYVNTCIWYINDVCMHACIPMHFCMHMHCSSVYVFMCWRNETLTNNETFLFPANCCHLCLYKTGGCRRCFNNTQSYLNIPNNGCPIPGAWTEQLRVGRECEAFYTFTVTCEQGTMTSRRRPGWIHHPKPGGGSLHYTTTSLAGHLRKAEDWPVSSYIIIATDFASRYCVCSENSANILAPIWKQTGENYDIHILNNACKMSSVWLKSSKIIYHMTRDIPHYSLAISLADVKRRGFEMC